MIRIHGGTGTNLVSDGRGETSASHWRNDNALVKGLLITTGSDGSVEVTGGDGMRVNVPNDSWAWAPDVGGVQIHPFTQGKTPRGAGRKGAAPVADDTGLEQAAEALASRLN